MMVEFEFPSGSSLVSQARDSVQTSGDWMDAPKPEAEFQETVNKSKSMLRAVALAESFNAAQQ